MELGISIVALASEVIQGFRGGVGITILVSSGAYQGNTTRGQFATTDLVLDKAFTDAFAEVDVISTSLATAMAATTSAATPVRLFFALHDLCARRGLEHPFDFALLGWMAAHDGWMEVVNGRISSNIIVSTIGSSRPFGIR